MQVDCKTVGFFSSKLVKKSVKRGVRVLRARSAYLNTQKYGLVCSLACRVLVSVRKKSQ